MSSTQPNRSIQSATSEEDEGDAARKPPARALPKGEAAAVEAEAAVEAPPSAAKKRRKTAGPIIPRRKKPKDMPKRTLIARVRFEETVHDCFVASESCTCSRRSRICCSSHLQFSIIFMVSLACTGPLSGEYSL